MSNRLVWWGYAVELVAAFLIVYLLILWLSADAVAGFVRRAAIDIATLFCAGMFAAALGFLWALYARGDTPFYRWLEEKGAFKVYLFATIYAVGVSFGAMTALIVAKYVDGKATAIIATFLLVLAVINLYSLIANVAGLIRLNAKYDAARRDT